MLSCTRWTLRVKDTCVVNRAVINPLTRVCSYLLVGVHPGDPGTGKAMAIQQTDGHVIFIKAQGWFPTCCSRNLGLTVCRSLGFCCCLLSLSCQPHVLICNICSCNSLYLSTELCYPQSPVGREDGGAAQSHLPPHSVWYPRACTGMGTKWWFCGGSVNPSPVVNSPVPGEWPSFDLLT